MQGYYLGIDGGGTKTESCIVDQSGVCLGVGRSAGSNPHNLPLGQVLANINDSVQLALNQSNLPKDTQFESACLGLAGLDSPAEISRIQNSIKLNSKKIRVCNDGAVAFAASSPDPSGIVVIASTGSNVYGLLPDGNSVSAGNHGYLFGDQGSGFFIGQAILHQITKEYDGRILPSDLTNIVLRLFDLSSFSDLVGTIYSHPSPISAVARLAEIISDPALRTNTFINHLCQTAIAELFESFSVVATKMEYSDASIFTIVFSGKLFLAEDRIARPLSNQISSKFPRSNIIKSSVSPAIGASKIALNL